MRRLLACGVAGLLATGLAAPALAAAPERTGWWSAVSAGTVVAPAPTTAAGDLRVANSPDGPLAYAAVLLTAPGASSATLDLLVRPGSVVGTPQVVACPTTTVDWPEGGNQPIAAAPEYDCAIGELFGTLSADGATLSFDLDATTQTAAGVWSLALVPQTGSTSPFKVDLQAPGPDSFTPMQADGDAGAPTVPDSGTGGGTNDAGTTGAGTDGAAGSGGTGSAGDLLLPGTLTDVPADSGTATPPLLADAAPVPAAAAPAPALADAAPQQLPGTAADPLLGTVATRPVAQDLPGNNRERLLALLMLVAISAGVGYLAGQQRPGPRLIGGRAGTAAVAAVPEPPARDVARERGIGRFARARTAAPRRLR